MARIARLGIGVVLVVALGAAPAFASPRHAGRLTAGYRLHIDLAGRGYVRELMTLQHDHTGYTDLDSIAWSRRGDRVTLVLTNREDGNVDATYVGTVAPDGISSRRDPGTIATSDGQPGVFYAVRLTR